MTGQSTERSEYRPYGKLLDLFYCQDEEILLDGPAGTGKSLGALSKLHLCAEKYAGMRGFIARKTRASLTQTLLVTFENEVVPPGHPCLGKGGRNNRTSYLYPNGSEIVCVGLDDPTRLMSSQYDMGLVGEALEITADDREKVSGTRMRHGVMPYQQVVYDTNPDNPSHHLWHAYEQGKLTRIPTTHHDNPRLWDGANWTPFGETYLARLKRILTGSRYDRLFLGLWSVAEGARFPTLDPNRHLFDLSVQWPQGVPDFLTKFVSVDCGFGAPYCALWHAVDFEGDIWTYREDYRTELSADQQAEAIREGSKANEVFYRVEVDPSAWNQDRFSRGRIGYEKSAGDYFCDILRPPQFASVNPGFRGKRAQLFSTLDAALNFDNGYPNWHIERSCVNLWRELQSAVLDKNKITGKFGEDLAAICDDHAITSAGYGLHHRIQAPEDQRIVLPTPDDIQLAREAERRAQHERQLHDPRRRRRL